MDEVKRIGYSGNGGFRYDLAKKAILEANKRCNKCVDGYILDIKTGKPISYCGHSIVD